MKKGVIEHVKGNCIDYVLERDNVMLLHCCNAQGVMGSGIAKEVRDRIPEAYEDYRQEYEDGLLFLGSVTGTEKVANLCAQDKYGRYQRQINYGALADCLLSVECCGFTGCPIDTIVVPYKMGADRAGGDWEIVVEMLEYFLKDYYIVACEI